MSAPVTTHHPRRRAGVKRAERRAIADRLETHLEGLQLHLTAIGRPAEAAAVATDLRLVAELRARLP